MYGTKGINSVTAPNPLRCRAALAPLGGVVGVANL